MSDLGERLRTELALGSLPQAEHALLTVLRGLGAMLPHHHRRPIARVLSAVEAEALLERAYDPELNAAELSRDVADAEHVRASFGIEHAEAVLAVLRDTLDPDVWRVMVAELPDDVRAIVPPARRRSAPPRALSPRSDAPPKHQHSVASGSDPHGDSTLSGARGAALGEGETLSGARGAALGEGETLADGAPGSERPVSSTEE